MGFAPANSHLTEDSCELLTGNDLFIPTEDVRSLTSTVSPGNDICDPSKAFPQKAPRIHCVQQIHTSERGGVVGGLAEGLVRGTDEDRASGSLMP